MLFQKGIAIDEANDDDIYSMLVPGESDNSTGGGGSGTAATGKGAATSNKKDTKKPNNIRSPFQENFPYDNIYQFQHSQTPDPD